MRSDREVGGTYLYTCPQSGVAAETLLEESAAEPLYFAIDKRTPSSEWVMKRKQCLAICQRGATSISFRMKGQVIMPMSTLFYDYKMLKIDLSGQPLGGFSSGILQR
jgi:hypothetical protein